MDRDALHDKFSYKDGVLYHKNPKGYRVKHGQPAGTLTNSGYLQTYVNHKIVLNHRVIYAMHYDDNPEVVDHIDGNKLNNNLNNLRAATKQQNSMNQKKMSTNKSGFKGVRKSNRTGNWIVEVWVNKRPKYFGTYKDIELADLVACMAREKYHGQFARHV